MNCLTSPLTRQRGLSTAVDGSLVSERLASFDLNAAAALAVDGIGFDAHQDNPRHDIAVHPTRPLRFGREITYALMFCMEYNIASNEIKTRELVMLDGAFSTGLIAISKALVSAQNHYDELYNDFFDRWAPSTMLRVPEIMTSDHVVALPKRSSSNEFVTQTRLFDRREIDTNGRSTASLILNANEFFRTVQLRHPYASNMAIGRISRVLEASSRIVRRVTGRLLQTVSLVPRLPRRNATYHLRKRTTPALCVGYHQTSMHEPGDDGTLSLIRCG